MARALSTFRVIGSEIVQILNAWFFCGFLLLAFTAPLHAQQDVKGSSDHPLFPNRMPGFAISYYQQLGYGSYNFHGKPQQKLEGKYTKISYLIKKDAPNPGDLAIRRNYENAVKAAGGQVVHADDYYSVVKIMRNGEEVWAEVITRPGGPQYDLNIIEREEMVQVISADAMANAIDRDGFVALDIQFATGKAEVLPESKPMVDQIVALMKKRTNLRVGVEGHTDNVGTPATNKALSQARAKAVAELISSMGINPSRLEAVGYGQERPIADNRLADGRAKNRRVEIVKR